MSISDHESIQYNILCFQYIAVSFIIILYTSISLVARRRRINRQILKETWVKSCMGIFNINKLHVLISSYSIEDVYLKFI